MEEKPLVKLQTLRLFRYRYKFENKGDENESFVDYVVGFNRDDILDEIYDKHCEVSPEASVSIEILDELSVDWIINQIDKGPVDLRKKRMKKKEFVFNLQYAKDRLIRDPKDKRTLERILAKIKV